MNFLKHLKIIIVFHCCYFNLQAQEISGIVFLDKNKDGIYNKGEKKLKNILVSNQKEIVLTNKKGEYTINLRDNSFLYVVKPTGYQVEINQQNFQENYFFYHSKDVPNYLNYKGVAATKNIPEKINFPLYKVDEKKPLKALIIGDPQMADDDRIDFYRDGNVTDMLRQQADFYVILGDIADDYLDIYTREKSIMSTLGIPGYHVPGNHDINYKSKNQENHFETFRKEFGPDYYAFNYNKTHFIVLNNVNYFGWNTKDNKRGSYFGGLDKTQLKWLKKDINLVPKEHLIVVNAHIPFLEKFTEPKILKELIALLKNRKVLFLSGHTHTVRTYNDSYYSAFEGVIAGSACGSWWTGPNDEEGIPVATSMDGTPKGYFVFYFIGADYHYKFVPAKHPEDYQIRVTIPLKTEPQYITANWFVGKPNEKVTISIDDKKPVVMKNEIGYDPFIRRTMRLRKNKDNWRPGISKTAHLWEIDMPKNLSKGAHKIEITATSASGKIYKGYKIFEIK